MRRQMACAGNAAGRSEAKFMLVQYSIDVPATAEAVFAYADDWTRLSSHMSESSWKMGGGKMRIDTDSGRGQRVGSHVRLSGNAFGIAMSLDEVVTERAPPHRKVWETVGQPRLLVIGPYRMGYEISEQGRAARFTVFLDYARPPGMAGRLIGAVFGPAYARWCTHQMADAVAKHFGQRG